jgi:hypothetical protein
MVRESWHEFHEKHRVKTKTPEKLRKPNRSGPFVWIVDQLFGIWASKARLKTAAALVLSITIKSLSCYLSPDAAKFMAAVRNKLSSIC